MTYSTDEMLEHIYFVAKHLRNCDPKSVVIVLLLELNVCPKYEGFDYLKRAVLYLYRNPGASMTKSVYPAVAEQCGGNVNQGSIEAGIRSVIDKAWKNRDSRIWSRYFPIGKNGEVVKMTNGEFIGRLAQVVEIWDECCHIHDREEETSGGQTGELPAEPVPNA